MVLARVESVAGNPLNEALFAAESTAVPAALELGSEPIVSICCWRTTGRCCTGGSEAGRLHADLDPRAIVQWLNTTTLFLLAPSWRHRSVADKRQFVEQFLVRALVPQIRH